MRSPAFPTSHPPKVLEDLPKVQRKKKEKDELKGNGRKNREKQGKAENKRQNFKKVVSFLRKHN